jgi:hypothetical protein
MLNYNKAVMLRNEKRSRDVQAKNVGNAFFAAFFQGINIHELDLRPK